MSARISSAWLLLVCTACTSPLADDENGDDPTTEGEEGGGAALSASDFPTPNMTPSEKEDVLAKYHLDPDHVIPHNLLLDAVAFYDSNKSNIDNRTYLTVVDFAKSSGKKRFYIVEMASGSVSSFVTAHGSGSDPSNTGTATRFGNVQDSNQSSLGFYVTADIYNGKHGASLRLDGVSTTNSNVRPRGIVIHGADYVEEGKAKQGRSWGCFALPMSEKTSVINKLKGGSVIYANKAD